MENATKGLMIAGAILIAIVLIGIGVALVSQSQGFMSTGTSQISDMEKSAFNSPIEQYEGPRRTGSDVKALLTKLNTRFSVKISSLGSIVMYAGIKPLYSKYSILSL